MIMFQLTSSLSVSHSTNFFVVHLFIQEMKSNLPYSYLVMKLVIQLKAVEM